MGLLALLKQHEAPGGCPDPEKLALYIENKLSAGERGQLQNHLSNCQDCYNIWLATTTEELLTEKKDLSRKSRRIMVFKVFGTALAAAASVAVYLNIQEFSDQQKTLVPGSEQVMENKAASIPQSSLEKKIEMGERRSKSNVTPAPVQEMRMPPAAKSVAPSVKTKRQFQAEKDTLPPQKAEVIEDKTVSIDEQSKPVLPVGRAEIRNRDVELSEETATSGAAARSPEPAMETDSCRNFHLRLSKACSGDAVKLEDWQQLHALGDTCLKASFDPDQRRKLEEQLKVLLNIMQTGDVAGGCAQLKGELAEEDQSR